LHAYVRLAQFKETASFKTWVHAIVRNRAIDHHRRARRRRSYTVAYGAHFPAHVEMRSDVRTPEELMLDGEREERLAAAMATLPERLRVTLTLWHSGDYSYEQMARIAGVRMGTIKSRVWEARQHVTKGFFNASRRASG
jgi:RNA polymerase sigma-70 factor (ECF subfamily)